MLSAEPQELEGEHLPTHVALCAVRYAGVNARLRRIEGGMWAIIGGTILGMGAIIVLLLQIGADLATK